MAACSQDRVHIARARATIQTGGPQFAYPSEPLGWALERIAGSNFSPALPQLNGPA